MTHRAFHLTEPSTWDAAQRSGRVEPPSLEREGFVHCSTREQIVGTIGRHFEGIDELMLLELDTAALADELRWEESRPGEVYPHLYRPIEVTEVTAILRWRRGPDGTVVLPTELR